MSEIAVEKLKQLLELGGKVSRIQETGTEMQIDVITGLDSTGSELEAIPITVSLAISKELKEFLSGDFVKDATYNPTQRGIVLVDMVGYSKGDTPVQSFFLMVLKCAIKRALTSPVFKQGDVDLIIPTGDGCYIIFNKCLNDKILEAAFRIFREFKEIQNLMKIKSGCPINKNNELYLRIGCELGETDFFFDINDNKNCYGDGMNEAARILSCGQSEVEKKELDSRDSIFCGESVVPQAERIIQRDARTNKTLEFIDLGVLSDKHCQERNVWWMRNLL